MPLALFDLDDTLLDRQAAMRAGVDEFLATFDLPRSEADWVLKIDDRGYADRGWFTEQLQLRYRDRVRPEKVADFWAAGTAPWVTVTDETRAALADLRASGWRVGVVTNGTVEAQTAKIRRCDLGDLVDAVAVSEGVGASKPESLIFRRAAEWAGCPLDGGWMVGDDPLCDVGGGVGVGLSTIWLPHGRSWPDLDWKPTHCADDVADAVRLMLEG